MTKNAVFLECRSEGSAGAEFLFAYQRSVLLALEQAGFLTAEELAACLRKLERLQAN